MLELQNLKILNKEAVELNDTLKGIVSDLEEQFENLENMRGVTIRIRKAFELYRKLMNGVSRPLDT